MYYIIMCTALLERLSILCRHLLPTEFLNIGYACLYRMSVAGLQCFESVLKEINSSSQLIFAGHSHKIMPTSGSIVLYKSSYFFNMVPSVPMIDVCPPISIGPNYL